ncbi:MAG: triose-phosphate isomerase [Gemmatimonadales bacterium]
MSVIAGNWKMHMGPAKTRAFFAALRLDGVPPEHELLIFPPAVSLEAACSVRPPRVGIGVQDVHWEDEGAFTGEVSASMAREVGATFALVGHSERRHLFGETDEQVARKTAAVVRNGLVPVVCVGETLAERRAGRVEEVILRQLDAVLPKLAFLANASSSSSRSGSRSRAAPHAGARALIAYEPVWAIGTGETATPSDASAAHATLRERLRQRLGEQAANAVPLLYGGSVKPDNARELLEADEVQGVLIGGASVEPGSFAAIAAVAPSGR